LLDSLHRDLQSRFQSLTEKHNKLQSDYSEMNDRYTDLIKSSLSKTEQLNLALKEKGDQLLAREKKLTELEAIIRRQDSITNALNDIVKKALLSFNSYVLTLEMKNGKVYVSLSDKLLFKSGSADVEEKGMDAIKKLSDVLNKNADIDILIEGHTDDKPIKTATFSDNWDLSTARANNIVRLLIDAHHVDPKRLTAAGRSEFQPRANNETVEGRAKNRRTEIVLTPKLDELYKLINKRR
jgi:chemotaxis protein MotB